MTTAPQALAATTATALRVSVHLDRLRHDLAELPNNGGVAGRLSMTETAGQAAARGRGVWRVRNNRCRERQRVESALGAERRCSPLNVTPLVEALNARLSNGPGPESTSPPPPARTPRVARQLPASPRAPGHLLPAA